MLDLNHTKLFVTFGLWWILLTIRSEQEQFFEGSDTLVPQNTIHRKAKTIIHKNEIS